MTTILSGGCLCGAVQFSLRDDFKAFYQCHCKQCQQLTGSAFAANIFTDPGNIHWTQGTEKIHLYEHPTREFSKSFCTDCGSALPFINQSKNSLIVPAGALADNPSIQPEANIFTSEKACWFRGGARAVSFESFPK